VEVLNLARAHQIGRTPKNGVATPFDFTEWWFRKIGTQILVLTKQCQIGRVPKNGTSVPFDKSRGRKIVATDTVVRCDKAKQFRCVV